MEFNASRIGVFDGANTSKSSNRSNTSIRPNIAFDLGVELGSKIRTVQEQHLRIFLQWLKEVNGVGNKKYSHDKEFIRDHNELHYSTYLLRFNNDLLFRLTLLHLYDRIEQLFAKELADSQLAQLIDEIKAEHEKAKSKILFSDPFVKIMQDHMERLSKRNAEEEKVAAAMASKNKDLAWMSFCMALNEIVGKKQEFESLQRAYDTLNFTYHSEINAVLDENFANIAIRMNGLQGQIFIGSLPPMPRAELNLSPEDSRQYFQKTVQAMRAQEHYSEEELEDYREITAQYLNMKYMNEQDGVMFAREKRTGLVNSQKEIDRVNRKLADSEALKRMLISALDKANRNPNSNPKLKENLEKMLQENQKTFKEISGIKAFYEPQLKEALRKIERLQVANNRHNDATIDFILTSLGKTFGENLLEEQKNSIEACVQQIQKIRANYPFEDAESIIIKNRECSESLEVLLVKLDLNLWKNQRVNKNKNANENGGQNEITNDNPIPEEMKQMITLLRDVTESLKIKIENINRVDKSLVSPDKIRVNPIENIGENINRSHADLLKKRNRKLREQNRGLEQKIGAEQNGVAYREIQPVSVEGAMAGTCDGVEMSEEDRTSWLQLIESLVAVIDVDPEQEHLTNINEISHRMEQIDFDNIIIENISALSDKIKGLNSEDSAIKAFQSYFNDIYEKINSQPKNSPKLS